MKYESIKMALAVIMTAVLACTGTYVAMSGQTEDLGHNLIGTSFPVLNLGNYMANDLLDDASPILDTELAGFASFSEFKEFQEKYGHYYSNQYYYMNDMVEGDSAAAPMMAGSGSSESYQTTTNIQVAGVDEGDMVKNDGQYAYIISGSGESVFIVLAHPADNAHILGEITSAGRFMDIYIQGDKLVMLEQVYYFEGGFQRDSYIQSQTPFVNVKVFDIENQSSPSLVREAALGGNYLTSRLIDNTLYLIGNQNMQSWENESQLPVPLEALYHLETGEEAYAITTFLTLDLDKPDKLPSIMGIVMASSNCIYVSNGNIYITHQDRKQYDNFLNAANNGDSETTVIHRIHINGQDLKYQARGEVPGRVLNRFSMDEFNGHFRIATTMGWTWGTGQQQSRNMVYVLNMAMEKTGQIDNIAPGEQIYSARFLGARCYLVTFRQVDPFYVIDVHDAQNPKILGELKIPGYSSYLHPYDENHIIGLGKDGSQVKLALFNVTDVKNPTELDSITVGTGYSDSLALNDPHAFMFSREKNLLVIPVYGYGQSRSTTGAYVFEITLENGITEKGQVYHDEVNESDDYYGYYYTYNQVKRSFIIDKVLYTVSGQMMKANGIEGLEELAVVYLE
ncbi:MAG: beta-propeller domain-containing protein [Thermoplasmata archaeon]|nr:beta-propeller domain-containing protein [Thermoplasmata archaeon]